MKIYTRTGDDGSTGLLGPGRVPKSSRRVDAYGTVDELNAALGTVHSLDREGWLADEMDAIQSQLFQVGAELATTSPQALATLDRVDDDDVATLERMIDRLEQGPAPLANFILPGGSPLGAQLHLARTICRRAERRLVALREAEAVEERMVRYLNRLGDLLFTMARWCNYKAGTGETEWRSGRRPKP